MNRFYLPNNVTKEKIKKEVEDNFDKMVEDVFDFCKENIINHIKADCNFLRIESRDLECLKFVNMFFKKKILRAVVDKINLNSGYEARFVCKNHCPDLPGIEIFILNKTAKGYVDEILKKPQIKKNLTIDLYQLYSISLQQTCAIPTNMTDKIVSLLKEFGYETDDTYYNYGSLHLISKV